MKPLAEGVRMLRKPFIHSKLASKLLRVIQIRRVPSERSVSVPSSEMKTGVTSSSISEDTITSDESSGARTQTRSPLLMAKAAPKTADKPIPSPRAHRMSS